MSPARSRRRPQARGRDWEAIAKAAAVSAAIVGVTALLIWLLRPGPPGDPATGGIMNRQPRASWLIAGAVIVGGIAASTILRGGTRMRRRAKVLLPVALVIVLGGTIAAGFAWPGGLLRHQVALPPPVTTPSTTTPPATTPTSPVTTGKTTPTTGAPSTTGATGTTATTAPSGATGPPTTPVR